MKHFIIKVDNFLYQRMVNECQLNLNLKRALDKVTTIKPIGTLKSIEWEEVNIDDVKAVSQHINAKNIVTLQEILDVTELNSYTVLLVNTNSYVKSSTNIRAFFSREEALKYYETLCEKYINEMLEGMRENTDNVCLDEICENKYKSKHLLYGDGSETIVSFEKHIIKTPKI